MGRAKAGLVVILVLIAEGLVRFGRMPAWRWTLGTHRRPEDCPPSLAQQLETRPGTGRRIARLVNQAADRMPFPAKCLTRAVALQWLLRFSRIPSSLFIAVHLTEREDEHAFHAWVESANDMLIGHCERDHYRPVMIVDQPNRR